MEDILQVGIITSPHGVRGEVRVYPTTDDVTRFKKLHKILMGSNSTRTNSDIVERNVVSVKINKNMAILKLEGIDSTEEANKYRQTPLFVERKDAVLLDAGEYFIADLIDTKVYDEFGEYVGVLKDVIKTGANDVYVIDRECGKELLLPAISECIINVDIAQGIMKVHILEGLMDL